MDPTASKLVASGLESFFNEESHAFQRCPGLIYKVDDTFGGIAVGQKIIYKKDFIILAQIVLL